MMLCYAKWYLCRRYTHIPSVKHTIFLSFIFRLHRLFFGVSALTFCCKPPLGASSPSISAVSALTFRCKPPLGASSPFISAESAFMFCIAAELYPPPEPLESLANPEAKSEDEIRKMAKAIMDKVVTQLLNEATEVVLREE